MRWESLFDDLESQLEGEVTAQFRDDVAQNIRAEMAAERIADRLSELTGTRMRIHLGAQIDILGTLGPVGSDYFCFSTDQADWIISLSRALSFSLPNGQRCRRYVSEKYATTKLTTLLRGVMRDRLRIQIFGVDATVLGEGTLHQVAHDFLVLLTHPRDEFARESSISQQMLVPLRALGWVLLPKHF